MELVKKNMVTVICGLVALVAVGAVFWPIRGYYDQLRTDVEARKTAATEFRGLITKERKMPVVSLEANAEAPKLEGFPTDQTIGKAREVVEKVKKEAQGMFERAVKLNEHKLLVDGALSDSSFAWTRFRQEYLKKLEMPNPQTQPNALVQPLQPYTIAKSIMNAGFVPSEQEINAARDKKAEEIKAQGVPGPGGGGIMNQPQIDAQLQIELPKVADNLKLKAAESCNLYIEPTALDPSLVLVQPGQAAGMQGGLGPSVIFNAQIGLWIYEDVARAIAAANKSVNAKDVRESVVKHFIKIDVVDEPFKPMMPGTITPEGTTPPNADPSAEIKPNFALSPTGRATNGVYDVVPFDVKIVVDAAQVPRILTELSRGRFVTVTNLSLVMVDSALKKSEGYYYGDNPVVELHLRCEALFMRKWTEPLMPTPIKQALGLAPAAQPVPQ